MKDQYQYIRKILTEVFKYKSFRPGQEDIINRILQGQDVFAIMPTGAGKSICFQIPALVLDGITIVISPLISLMRDQVDNLKKLSIAAVFLNKSITTGQLKKSMKDIIKGIYKIVYIAPERLESEGFVKFIKQVKVSLVVIDEAHCITHWGYGFRPSYLYIPIFFEKLKIRPIFAAFTATASVKLANDIIKLLKLKDPFLATTGFERPNLYFDVFKIEEQNKIKLLLKIFKNIYNESTIIYCQTRKIVDFLFIVFSKKGFKVTKYHAGLTNEARRRNQISFLNDEVTILIATNAFGMGIDKKDVRNIIHYNMPKSLEDYYQEAGRAGRDGKKSYCVMLYSVDDIRINKFFIEKTKYTDKFTDDQINEFKQNDYKKLEDIVAYCETSSCYRNQILKYFGDTKQLEDCHFCGNCSKNFIDISDIARSIIFCIKEFNGLISPKSLIRILKGSLFLTKKTKRSKSYSSLKQVSSRQIKVCIKELITRKYIIKEDINGGKLKITQEAIDFTLNNRILYIKIK